MTKLKLMVAMAAAAILALVEPALADDRETVSHDVDAFTEIETEGAFELIIAVGEEQSVEVVAAERDQKRIEVAVDDGVLTIRYRERFFDFLRDHKARSVHVSVPELHGLSLNGATSGEVSGIDAERFSMESNGMADFELAGRCGELDLSMNGMGDTDAKDLECERVDVNINGMGDATVYASESITAVLNGMGDISVYGNPKEVKPRIDGFGDFEIVE